MRDEPRCPDHAVDPGADAIPDGQTVRTDREVHAGPLGPADRHVGPVLPADRTALAGLLAAAVRAPHDPAGAVDSLGWLGPQLAADRAAGAFDAWGASTLVDEITGAPVLGRAVADELHRRAGLPSSYPVGNAGLLHVYGYLLSTAVTPYGAKRDRWVDGALAVALGLGARDLLPWWSPDGSTLLARVTRTALPWLTDGPPPAGAPGVPGPARLSDGSTSAGPSSVILRRDDPDGAGGTLRTVVLTTAGRSALVYGHLRGGRTLLVTTFPVAAGPAWLAALAAEPARPRYNVVARPGS